MRRRLSLAIVVAPLLLGASVLRADPAAPLKPFFVKVNGESVRVSADGKLTFVSDGTGTRAQGTFTGQLTQEERAELAQVYAGLAQLPTPTAQDKVVGPNDSRTHLEFVGPDGLPRKLDVNTKFIIRPELKALARFAHLVDRIAPPKKAEMTFALTTPQGPAKLWISRDGESAKIEVGPSEDPIAFVGSLTTAEKDKLLAARARFLDLPIPTQEESALQAGAPSMELFFRDRVEAARMVKANQAYMKKNLETLKPLMDAMDAVFQRLSSTTPPISKGFISKVPGPN